MNYYNEHDPNAAAWLRELIKADLIAPGEVDERDIQDVVPNELAGFTQCHLFAGIGVWSYALRCAGWPDDRPVWTGSCPCQPFSAAGKRKGIADERHLWPAFFHLISVNKPDVVFGEQVASKDGFAWLDVVHADLEAEGFTVGAVDLCAAGVGAPHIRQRLFFVANTDGQQADPSNQRRFHPESFSRCDARQLADAVFAGRAERRTESGNGPIAGSGESRILGNPSLNGIGSRDGQSGQSDGPEEPVGRSGFSDELGDSQSERCGEARTDCGRSAKRIAEYGQPSEMGDPEHGGCEIGESTRKRTGTALPSGPANGFWRDAEWTYCRDEKYRAVGPGSFPLVNGAPARVGRLRGYGNAIVAPVAEEFIRAFMETQNDS